MFLASFPDEKMFVCQWDQECDIHYKTINKYNIT